MKGKKTNKHLKEWHENEIVFFVGKRKVEFKIVSNVENMEACIDNWLARTTNYTKKSLIKYINSKNWANQYAYKDLNDLVANHEGDII